MACADERLDSLTRMDFGGWQNESSQHECSLKANTRARNNALNTYCVYHWRSERFGLESLNETHITRL